MNATKVIEAMGGRRRVMDITGLSKGRISQWTSSNHIPDSWMVAFRALDPEAVRKAEGGEAPTPQP
ncbi:hypothetical protein GCM10011400_51590 [Paraburkholderia caffeinilytica]|uniref:Cro/Cl family transcriptional regulator n=1 Tax=Paraburkholderia caffeinilytica TaxID=1761016 RepID=A0ABQ1NC09_9BURK|nr:hypothetical protein GCM10011400_51590 [Paraburkholderia caffeinilytica]CAB3804847.1 hypothetical protein LMG28690_06100 [Paraburkholderia caffeinilytica]